VRLGSMGLVSGEGSFIVEIQLVVEGGERCCWVGMHSIASGVHVIWSCGGILGCWDLGGAGLQANACRWGCDESVFVG
jgi:hypothetical protein